MMKALSVRLCEEPVGLLEFEGKMKFAYVPDAARKLSLSMPKREAPYNHHHCESFFGGLLPDSKAVKRKLGQVYKINPNSSFNLLQAIGGDCAGAVSLVPVGTEIKESDEFEFKAIPLNEEQIATMLRNIKDKPLLAGLGRKRMSLAGAQDKTAITMINNEICIPADDSPTTHILKPPITGVEDSVANEFFCMTVARQIGLNIPNVEIRSAADTPYLLVERYDREYTKDHKVRRIHQEDFCQALNVLPDRKYQIDGGPTLAQCFQLLENTTVPAIAINELIQLVVLNYLVGNNDAHAKNFALLHLSEDGIILAPGYDILCTRVYEFEDNLAMAIGGEYEHKLVARHHWEKLTKSINYSFKGLQKIAIMTMQNALLCSAETIKIMKDSGTYRPVVQRISEELKLNAEILAHSLNQ
ncbi:MAG: type II toxin-antitoxin system HipA family toxin [Candidatus Obscuribacterales bacterium]